MLSWATTHGRARRLSAMMRALRPPKTASEGPGAVGARPRRRPQRDPRAGRRGRSSSHCQGRGSRTVTGMGPDDPRSPGSPPRPMQLQPLAPCLSAPRMQRASCSRWRPIGPGADARHSGRQTVCRTRALTEPAGHPVWGGFRHPHRHCCHLPGDPFNVTELGMRPVSKLDVPGNWLVEVDRIR